MAKEKTRSTNPIHAAYENVKEACASTPGGAAAERAIFSMVEVSLGFLAAECKPIALTSKVLDKQYKSYTRQDVQSTLSRPFNIALFAPEIEMLRQLWTQWISGQLAPGPAARLLYTMAISPCLAMEMFDRNNRKGPATYFECLIGHVLALATGKSPAKKASVPFRSGVSLKLTMDFLLRPTADLSGLHCAAKMSTRERVVQAWAHQRILDAAYGLGKYRGVMILFSETKLSLKKREVVEICVPDQWLSYQTFLARMDCIYYFDAPARYEELAAKYHDIVTLKPFAEFLSEKATLLAKSP